MCTKVDRVPKRLGTQLKNGRLGCENEVSTADGVCLIYAQWSLVQMEPTIFNSKKTDSV
jgi:hypothetical protein